MIDSYYNQSSLKNSVANTIYRPSSSLLDTIISWLLLPPLFILYIISYQFLLILGIIDQLAENSFVKSIVKRTTRAIAIQISILVTIWGWITKPFKWFADTFIWRTIYSVYKWLKSKVWKDKRAISL